MYDIDRNARQAQGQCELVPNTRYDYVCGIVSASFLFWGGALCRVHRAILLRDLRSLCQSSGWALPAF